LPQLLATLNVSSRANVFGGNCDVPATRSLEFVATCAKLRARCKLRFGFFLAHSWSLHVLRPRLNPSQRVLLVRFA